MQLNENKNLLNNFILDIFGVPSTWAWETFIKVAIMLVLTTFECALNSDLLIKLQILKLEVKILRIEIRNDSVILDGYVNAVARDSRPMLGERGEKFVEQISQKTFQRALEKSNNVLCLLNHEPSRKLGSTNRQRSNRKSKTK